MRTVAALLCLVATGCGRCGSHADEQPAVPSPEAQAEARARAAFPKGAVVGIPDDLHGLTAADDGSVTLAGLTPPRALAVLVDAWGAPTMDLVAPDTGAAKGWSSASGTCALLDGIRIVFLGCDAPSTPADDPQLYAGDEQRVRETFRPGAPFAMPSDTHGMRVRGDGPLVLPAMPSRQLFLAFKDAFGESETESWTEGYRHVTIWRRETTCAVLDQCHDPKLTDHRCWALLWFVPCGSAKELTSGGVTSFDPRWGKGP